MIQRLIELYQRVIGWIGDHEKQVVTYYVWFFVALFAALTIRYLIKASQLL